MPDHKRNPGQESMRSQVKKYMRMQDALDKIQGAESINTPKTQTSLTQFFSPKICQINDGDQKSTLAINS